MIDLAPNNPYGLALKTPYVAAAGCLAYGVEYARLLGFASGEDHGLGAIITRTTTLRPRRARPEPAMLETAAGLLYCGGTQNPGLRVVIERYAPIWEQWGVQVILSIAGESLAEYSEMAEHLEEIAGIAAVEIPLQGYSEMPTSELKRLISAVRRGCQLPIIVKLPVYGFELAPLIAEIGSAGADAINISGGIAAVAPDTTTEQLRNGELCGPAIYPLALATIAEACTSCALPIIGGAGISSAERAHAFRQLGIQALSIGSALLRDPQFPASL